MADQFNLDNYLMEKDFSFTNEGQARFYSITKGDHNYRMALNGNSLVLSSTKDDAVETVKVPKTKADADKLLKGFVK